MSIQTDIKQIGPSTFMAVLAIRNRWWHCNGTMTRKRQIYAICRPPRYKISGRRRYRAKSLGYRLRFHERPGSHEHARLAHLEMERIALRRPELPYD